ncbi:MAG: hypothetical protein APF76_11905 [Desulfitibacter sp. BRH_c19]|nr:MAG: hypothetical protein APF76_11905 [Desulfitibacter sp. BRH_c19]
MYEYRFIKIKLKSGFKGRKPEEDYHEIIEQYAREGWRLVQIFAPAISGYGAAEFYELIFERNK